VQWRERLNQIVMSMDIAGNDMVLQLGSVQVHQPICLLGRQRRSQHIVSAHP
jgi:hypothetical protein